MLQKLERALFFLIILFLPTQLGRHFWPQFSFVYSLPIDYLSPTIYFWDLLAVLTMIVYTLQFKFVNKTALNCLFIFLLSQGLSLLPAIFSQNLNLGAGLVRLEQYLVVGIFGVYIASKKFKELVQSLVWPLLISIIFESTLGVLQFIISGSLNIWILGERSFSLNTPAIAKFNLSGHEFLRPYATLPHPNTLAAYLIISLPLLFLNKPYVSKVVLLSSTILAGLTILLTVSRVALLAGLVEALTLIKNKLLIFLLLAILISSPILFIRFSSILSFDDLSLFRREGLIGIAWNIFSQHPFFGVGLNNFIPFAADTLLVGPNRFLQPVHNIYLLILSETGLIGLAGFLSLIIYPLRQLLKINYQQIGLNTILLLWEVILFLGLFDHYFLTQPQGYRLFFLFWGLTHSFIFAKMSS